MLPATLPSHQKNFPGFRQKSLWKPFARCVRLFLSLFHLKVIFPHHDSLLFLVFEQALKPSQGLVLRSPSNNNELVKLWLRGGDKLCFRVVKPQRGHAGKLCLVRTRPRTAFSSVIAADTNTFFLMYLIINGDSYPNLVCPEDYVQGELQMIPLDRIDFIKPLNEKTLL